MKYSNITVSSIIIGGIDGICTCPLDNLKTRCHLYPNSSIINSCGGIYSLFNGFIPYTSQIILKTSVRFSIYNEILNVLNPIVTHKEHAIMISGSLAGIVEGILCTTPLERVKIHSQVLGYPNLCLHGIRDIVQTHGFMTLWQGGLPTVIRQGTSLGTRFITFDKIQNHINDNSDINENIIAFIAGGSAGVLSVILNNPFDIIKTSIQSGKTYGFWNTLHYVCMNQGYSIMYNGLSFRIPRIFISQGITFSVYQIFSEK